MNPKVGIITMHSVCNYGTQLQAFATQEKMKKYFGDNIEFIDFKRENTYGKGLKKEYSKGNFMRLLAFLPTYYKWKKVFGKFQKKYLNISKESYLNINDFKNFNEKYDIYFSGSDQVWNTGWNNGIIPPYYLSFAPDNKPKYAYASSFGLVELNKNDIPVVKKYLSKYRKISVREQSGLDIINNQLNLNNAIRIIDPTLVMDKKFWSQYETKNKIKEKYILIYNLKSNDEFENYAKKLSKETGFKLYRFCTRYDQMLKIGKPIIIPDIFEFITLIDNAEYVLTDSFHATAFSINMHTKPICIYPKKYSSRLNDFLKLVNSEEKCHVKNLNDFSIAKKDLDYEDIDKILDVEREKVDKFLTEIKQEV